MQVEVLCRSHLAELRLQASQLHETQHAQWQAMAARCVDAGNAFAARDALGRVVFCGGAIVHHSGYASLWGRFSEDRPRVPVFITRAVRRFVAGLPYARVDASAVASDEHACGWLELIGLQFEACLRGAGSDGGDLMIYARGWPYERH